MSAVSVRRQTLRRTHVNPILMALAIRDAIVSSGALRLSDIARTRSPLTTAALAPQSAAPFERLARNVSMKTYHALLAATAMCSLSACSMFEDDRDRMSMSQADAMPSARNMSSPAMADGVRQQMPTQSAAQSAQVAPPSTQAMQPDMAKNAMPGFEQTVAMWPERPRLGARQMMLKYGPPQEITSEQIVWRNAGPYKRIMVTKTEIPHDFPLPHMDFMEHTIEYMVPVDKTDELIAFDGSSTINRTAGELSARCDLEGHNVLTLNLDHDIVTGKKTVEQARKAFGENVVADFMGKKPPYVEALQFKPAEMMKARFADKPVIPGAPVRGSAAAGSDAEIMAFSIAVDMNEILAAAQAQQKKIRPDVMAYAKMLQTDHSMATDETMKLGLKLKVTPTDTPAVDKLKVKGAGELAMLVPLDGPAFEKAYLDAMVKGHTEVLAMIDTELLPNADNAELKAALTKKRASVSSHLEKAKSLQTT